MNRDDPARSPTNRSAAEHNRAPSVDELRAGFGKATAAPARRVIGNYELLAPLGQGGMGRVYMARHVVLDRRVAIKVLRAAVATDPSVRARFLTEARAIAAIDHPNVVTIYDSGVSEQGAPYLAMELLEGETLSQQLTRGAIDVAIAARIMCDVVEGVSAAHARGVIHRDLKPSNIMLVRGRDGREHAKILDFGVAKIVDDLGGDDISRVGFVVGTPGYMAPEQCRGLAVDERGDIYSLGVILYRVLTGNAPYRAAERHELLRLQVSESPRPPRQLVPTLPIAVEAVVMRCLELRPERRFASALDLLDALRGMLRADADANHPTAPALPQLAAAPTPLRSDGARGDSAPVVAASWARGTEPSFSGDPTSGADGVERPRRARRIVGAALVAGATFAAAASVWLRPADPRAQQDRAAPAELAPALGATPATARAPLDDRAVASPAVAPQRQVSELTSPQGKEEPSASSLDHVAAPTARAQGAQDAGAAAQASAPAPSAATSRRSRHGSSRRPSSEPEPSRAHAPEAAASEVVAPTSPPVPVPAPPSTPPAVREAHDPTIEEPVF
jgi:serine/threonine protein kinase